MAGRPRKCSIEKSLDLALEVFWRRGYEGTSIQDLSQALGVGPSSIYSTFGSKEGLYQRTMERYIERNGRFVRDALTKPDAIEALLAVLQLSVTQYTQCDVNRGCAVLSAQRVDRPDRATVDAFLVAKRAQTLDALRQRIQTGIDEAHLAADTDVEGLARFTMGILQGLSAQACDGADADALHAMISHAKDHIRSLAP